MAPEQFVLRSTLTSPFGRKARIAADVLGLNSRITLAPADPLDEKDTLRAQNPLGKMPCLLTADGSAIYDSGVIIEFLQDVAGGEQMVPASGPARFKALTRARLADGITEAALLIVYETRFRDPGTQSERWLAHQRGKITRALAAFEAAPQDPCKTDIVAIGLPARSAISTGARAWTGGRRIPSWWRGLRLLPKTSRRSSARARQTHKGQEWHNTPPPRPPIRPIGRRRLPNPSWGCRRARRIRMFIFLGRANNFRSRKGATTRRPTPRKKCCLPCMQRSASNIA